LLYQQDLSRPERPARRAAQTCERDHAYPRTIDFGRFSLVTHSRDLLADGVTVPLGGRAIDVLFVLVEARGMLVTKDELLDRVWPTATVEENCLQFQISMLRKALGPDRDFIRTVSGRGYRFVAEISTSGERTGAHSPPQPLGLSGQDRHSTTRTNLPASTSGLIGRELALELGRRMLGRFDGGVRVVELAPLSDPTHVLPAVALALDLGRAGGSAEDPAAALGPDPLLLVLHNCEHLVGAAAMIVEALLYAKASQSAVATNREPLRAEA
jgi:non-specific serine/threonine protein kinase